MAIGLIFAPRASQEHKSSDKVQRQVKFGSWPILASSPLVTTRHIILFGAEARYQRINMPKKKLKSSGTAETSILVQFPPEIFHSIVSHSSGYDVGRLWLSGDKKLHLLINRGGITTFTLRSRTDPPPNGLMRWPTLIEHFTGLKTVILDSSYDKNYNFVPISHIRPDRLPSSVTELRLTCLQAENCFIKDAPTLGLLFPHQYPKGRDIDISTFSDSEEWSSEEEEPMYSDEEGKKVKKSALEAQLTPRLNTLMERMEPPTVSIYNQAAYGKRAWHKDDSYFNFEAILPNLRILCLNGGKKQLGPVILKHLPKSLTKLKLVENTHFQLHCDLPKHLKHLSTLSVKVSEEVVAAHPNLAPLLRTIAVALPKTALLYSSSDRLVELNFLTFGSKDSISPATLPRSLKRLSIESKIITPLFVTPKYKDRDSMPNPWPESLTYMHFTGAGKLPSLWPPNLKHLRLDRATFSKPRSMLKLPPSIEKLALFHSIEASASVLALLPRQLKTLKLSEPILAQQLLDSATGEPVLPPHLLRVAVGRVSRETAACVAKGLPRTITKLALSGREFTSLKYLALPTSITSLQLQLQGSIVNHKLTARLPPNLKDLRLSCRRLKEHTLERLPPGLTRLTVWGSMSRCSPRLLSMLPRGITDLTIPKDALGFELGILEMPRGVVHMPLLFPTYVSFDVAIRLPPSFGFYPIGRDTDKWRADCPGTTKWTPGHN